MPLTDEQIATELRALRETPSEEFAAELDAWAAAGFPARETQGATTRKRRPRKAASRSLSFGRFVPALAALGLTVVVVGSVIAIDTGQEDAGDSGGLSEVFTSDGDDSAPSGGTAERGAAGTTPPGAAAAPDAAIEPASPTTVPPVPGQPREQLKPGQDRIQEKSASMTLSTDPGDVDDVADEVVGVVDRYEGIVVSSEVNTSEQRSRAAFDLRIPTANLRATLSDLSDLASVSSRDEGTLDITAPFISAEERFDDAKAEADALLEQLAEADSSTEIAEIRARLQTARAELAAARSELGALKQRADFSKLSLTVVGDGDADGWSIGDAADDAVSVLEDIAGGGLVALAVIIPLGGIALLAWLGLGALQRRQRERTLD